jgi:hypothetical protein
VAANEVIISFLLYLGPFFGLVLALDSGMAVSCAPEGRFLAILIGRVGGAQ